MEMANERDTPLHVGDRVTLRNFASGQSGIVVDCLSHDYFLVRWDGYREPSAHHRFSLRRAVDAVTSSIKMEKPKHTRP